MLQNDWQPFIEISSKKALSYAYGMTITYSHRHFTQSKQLSVFRLVNLPHLTFPATSHIFPLLPPLSHAMRGSYYLICFALSTNRLHPSRSSDVLFHSTLLTSTLSKSLLTLSLHLNCSLPVLLLPPVSVFRGLSVILSSLLICMCPHSSFVSVLTHPLYVSSLILCICHHSSSVYVLTHPLYLSSLILCICLAHHSLLATNFMFRRYFIPIIPLLSPYLLVPMTIHAHCKMGEGLREVSGAIPPTR